MRWVSTRTWRLFAVSWAVLMAFVMVGQPLAEAMTPPVSTAAQTAAQAVPTFGDLGNHWAKDDISYLAGLGIVNGYADPQGNKTIRPDNTMTRAELVKTLVGLRG